MLSDFGNRALKCCVMLNQMRRLLHPYFKRGRTADRLALLLLLGLLVVLAVSLVEGVRSLQFS